MIDYFAIGLSHALIFYVCWRLLLRDDLDDPAAGAPDTAKPGATPASAMSAGARHRAAIAQKQGGEQATHGEDGDA